MTINNLASKTLLQILLFALFSLIVANCVPRINASPTTITFQPIISANILGQQFKLNVTIIDVTNLNNWQISLKFNPKIINCTNITVPEDNIFQGYSIFFPTPKIDNVNGQLTAFCAIEGTAGVSGSGKLCTITFQTKNLGVSTLNYLNPMVITLNGTYLQDPNGQSIPFETEIGVIQIVGQGFGENAFTITYDSETLKIKTLSNSTITNLNYDQTLKAITYDATGPDNTKGACIITIPQKIMNTTLIALSDNTPLKTFISELNTLPENGTHHFLYYSYSHSTNKIKIFQTIAGDITGDRKVDIKDVAIASKSFGTTSESPNYRQAADVNDDAKVDIKDVSYISKNFGKYFQQ